MFVFERFYSIVVGALAVFASIANAGDQTVERFDNQGASTLHYLLYQPDLDSQAVAQVRTEDGRIPLLLFLHGGGEGGDNIEKVKMHGPPRLIKEGKDFPFFVVSPQNPSTTQFWDDQSLMALVDHLVDRYAVDPSRIYLTGMSRGGFGAWRLAIQNPDRFACLVPICGGGDPPYVRKIKQMPIWVFHGQRDDMIPISESEQMVDALRELGNDVKFTVYPNAKHDAWTETYGNDDLYTWMLEQRIAIQPQSDQTRPAK
ncbi:Prolyl oligopeptidase family protein [Rubripirellula tenax]|uniref:Prolyl oligopeptidase family protein n=1 Tax=Rubripirellula tenax TaxID=2528015 RepID=A0A5C6EFL5_9BACT|nr:prolyl oligopeptidase family serine peptidase [Rubripirellula tenax]TWU47254.1 Prolyl oligopeptidase family protein [Rubripirellula tenax]